MPNPASLHEKHRADMHGSFGYTTAWFPILVNSLPILAHLAVYGSFFSGDMVASMKTPHKLSREAIDEFKVIDKDEFGEELSDDEVREIATRLLRFFGHLNKEHNGSVDALNL